MKFERALCLTAVSLALAAPRATAAEPTTSRRAAMGLATGGNLVLSAERLFGFTFAQVGAKANGTESKTYGSNLGLGLTDSSSLYQAPRLALDYLVTPGLSLGGSLGYTTKSRSSDRTSNGATTTTEGETAWAFLVAPRVGYVFDVSPAVAIWLRGGVTYYAGEVDPRLPTDNTVTKVSGFSGTLDPQLVISPASHFAFTLGLTADIPFSGSYASKKGNTSSSIDVSDLCVGLTTGLLGWF